MEKGLLEQRAESVAEFLYKEEGLNKTAIGSFLGERYSSHTHKSSGSEPFLFFLIFPGFLHREELHLEILKAFVGLHEFSDLNLVQALRFVSRKNFCT